MLMVIAYTIVVVGLCTPSLKLRQTIDCDYLHDLSMHNQITSDILGRFVCGALGES
jgi:hypothetical protein